MVHTIDDKTNMLNNHTSESITLEALFTHIISIVQSPKQLPHHFYLLSLKYYTQRQIISPSLYLFIFT